MTPPPRCTAFGYRIATDIVLPGAVPDDGGRRAQIVIRRTTMRASPDAASPTLRRDGKALVFSVPRIADYRCTADTIGVAPWRDADEAAVAALLIATALPATLWLGGAFMLHAAAAILPGHDRAIAIAAASGVGKSTVLAQLVARGARIVADDSLCLRATDAGIVASGLPGGYFAHDADPAARPFVTVGPQQVAREAPLGAILALMRHAPNAPATLCRVAPLDALTTILSHRHRPAIPALAGDPGERLGDAARIARVPVYRWSRPDGMTGLTTDEREAIDRLDEGVGNV